MSDVTREAVAVAWQRRARGQSGVLGVVYGVVALVWAVLHLAERVDQLVYEFTRREGRSDQAAPPYEVDGERELPR